MSRSIQAALLDHHILAHDEPVSGHLTELWQDAIHMFVGIYEAYDNWKLATGFDQMCGVHVTPPKKSRNRMKRNRARNTLASQIFEQFQMKRTVAP